MKPSIKKENPNPLIGVIVVTFNDYQNTLKCLKSIKAQVGVDTNIYLVNNGSESTISKRLKQIRGIKLINSAKNLGYAGGNNLGITQALKDSCTQILLLNNDAILTNIHSLKKLSSGNLGISAPIVRYKIFGEVKYDFGGKIDRVFGHNTHYVARFKKQDHYPKADYYSGVCLMIEYRVFKKIGLLDDGYFLYYEDADFCLRASKAGFKLRLVPQVVINHLLSASTNKLGKHKLRILASSHLKFAKENLPASSSLFIVTYNLYLKLKSF